jgi:glutamyl-tRNA synthetase
MSVDQSYIVTRFAPSPTGHLHIGGARSALFCWAFARTQNDAKGRSGRFMIRIEDTDQARSSEESARGILEDLAWLGIDWQDGPVLKKARRDGGTEARTEEVIGGDERGVGPYFQAQRVKLYDEQLERLVRMGRAYPAFEQPEEIEAQRKAAVAAKRTYRYPRPADIEYGVFNAALADRWKRAQAGERHVMRFASPHEEIVVHDQILGDVRIAAGELDDFVIRKADGFPTYHFAVVVDDELMGVSHVLRAKEHLINTPRHVALQKALGFRVPFYGHMPVICNMDGAKMSKRDKAKAARKAAKDAMAKDKAVTAADIAAATGLDAGLVAQFIAADNDSLEIAEALGKHFKITLPEIEIWDFRKSGYLPEAIVNFVALLGWNPGMKTADGKDLEKFDMAFMAEHFSIDRVGKGDPKFDRNKLLSFNGDAIAGLSEAEFVKRWLAWLAEHEPEAHARASRLSREQLLVLARALKPRAKTLRDALKAAGFALVADDAYGFDAAAVEKNLRGNGGAGLALLAEFRPRLDQVSAWTPESITGAIEAFAKEKGMPNPGGIAQPLRVALTGSSVSPGLGETMAVLGRGSSLERIGRCLGEIRA